MTWDQEFDAWKVHQATMRDWDDETAYVVQSRVSEGDVAESGWLRDALLDPTKKWFVAHVFASQAVPESFLPELIRAGVYEHDPSFNRCFVEPCVRDFGAFRIYEALLSYLRLGSDEEKAGAANALYWVHLGESDQANELRGTLHSTFLREFVRNTTVMVRQSIIPMLVLKPEVYPEELRALVPQAVAIARAHPDEYIRHRIEIQLGAGGSLMPIPTSRIHASKKRWWEVWK
jgi:hypothetical protein